MSDKTDTSNTDTTQTQQSNAAEAKGMIKVFVYGTLKSTHYNNQLMLKNGGKFIGYDFIEGPYIMVDLGPFPAVLDLENTAAAKLGKTPVPNRRIYGELWAISQEALAHVDYLEGHPNFYRRRKLNTGLLNIRAWTYFNTVKDLRVNDETTENWHPTEIESAYWTNYNKTEVVAS